MNALLCKNNCRMESIGAIRLLEAVVFCTGVSGTQAHSGGLMDRRESVGWSLPRAKAHRSLPYRGTAHGIDIDNIPQRKPENK